MEASSSVQKAYDQCLKYISFKNRTEQEVFLYLEKKEYSERTIAEVMAKLIQYAFINDKAYIRHYCDTNFNFSYNGRVKMRYDLKRRGIPDNLLYLLDDLYTEEMEENCCEKQFKKAERQYSHEPYQKKKSKIYGFLQRKGFKSELIRSIIEKNLVQEEEELSQEEVEILMERRMTELVRYYERYKRNHENRGHQGYALKQRIIKSLMGRGYSYDMIKDVLENQSDEESE